MTDPDSRTPTPETADQRNAHAPTGDAPGDPAPNARETETRDPKPPKVGGLGGGPMTGLSAASDSGGGSDTGGNTEPKAGLGATPIQAVGPPEPDPDPKPPKHGLGVERTGRPPTGGGGEISIKSGLGAAPKSTAGK